MMNEHEIVFLMSEGSLRHMLDLAIHGAEPDELISDLLMRVRIETIGA